MLLLFGLCGDMIGDISGTDVRFDLCWIWDRIVDCLVSESWLIFLFNEKTWYDKVDKKVGRGQCAI